MAKRYVTGVLLEADHLEWATLLASAEHLPKVGAGRIDFATPGAPAAPATEEAATTGEQPAAAESTPSAAAPSAAAPSAAADSASEAAALKRAPVDQIRAGLKGRPRGEVTMGIPSEHVLLRVVSLPSIDAEDIAGMVQLHVDKISPFPIEMMVVSHEILKHETDHSLVLIAAARQDLVDSMGATLTDAGWAPARVDASLLGWWRLMRDAGETGGDGRQVAVLLEGGLPQIMIFQAGMPLVFRTVANVQDLSPEALAEEVATEVGYTLMSLELEHGTEPCSVTIWARGDGYEALENRLAAQCSSKVVRKSPDSLPGVCEGLARRGAERQALNLTPESWRTLRAGRRFKSRTWAGFGAILGTWFLGFCALFGGLYLERGRLAALKGAQAGVHAPAMEVRELRRRVVMVQRYGDSTHSVLECLRETCDVLPAGIEMTSFSYTKGESLKLVGEALDTGLIYEFKDRLDKSKLFAGVTLGGQTQIRSRNKYGFDVDIRLPREKE